MYCERYIITHRSEKDRESFVDSLEPIRRAVVRSLRGGGSCDVAAAALIVTELKRPALQQHVAI